MSTNLSYSVIAVFVSFLLLLPGAQAQRICPAGLAQLTAGIVGPDTDVYGEIVEGHMHLIDPELASGDFLPSVLDFTPAQLQQINAGNGLFHGGTVCFTEIELALDWVTGLRTRKNQNAALVSHFLLGKARSAGLLEDGLTNHYDIVFVRDDFINEAFNRLAADAASGASTLEEIVVSVVAINELGGAVVGSQRNVALFGEELFVASFDSEFEQRATLRTDPDIISSIITPDGMEFGVDGNGFIEMPFRDIGSGELKAKHHSGLETPIATLDFTQVSLDVTLDATCKIGETVEFDASNVSVNGLPDSGGRFEVDLNIERQTFACKPGNNSSFVHGSASFQPVINLPLSAARIALALPTIVIEFVEEIVIEGAETCQFDPTIPSNSLNCPEPCPFDPTISIIDNLCPFI